MNKGREFWVIRNVRQDSYELRKEKPKCEEIPLGDERIHLIEYQAYKKVLESLKALANSQVVKQAEFIGYSEAYLIAVETLKELGEHE